MELQHSIIDDKCLFQLRKYGINTIEKFLEADNAYLIKSTELSTDEVRIIKNYFQCVFEDLLPISQTEYEGKLRQNHNENKILETGIASIDERMKGLTLGSIIEVIGKPEAGKTKLCMSISVNMLQRCNLECFWIDTKMDYSPIAMEWEMRKKYQDETLMIQAMKKIHVQRALKLNDLIEALKHLIEAENIESGLLILDSMSSILADYMGERYKVRQEGLKKVINYVRNLCAKKNFICVLTGIPKPEKMSIHEPSPMTKSSANIKIIFEECSSERLFIFPSEDNPQMQSIQARNSNKRDILILKSSLDHRIVSRVPIHVTLTTDGVL